MTDRIAIGLDFDDTLMSTREVLIALLNQTHGTSIRLEDCTDFFMSNRWNLTRQQFLDFFTQHEEQIHRQPPMPGVLETLREWSSRADFYVITGRPAMWMDSMFQWLNRYEIPISAALCAEREGGKAACASKHGLAFFVDDRADFSLEIAGAGIPTILLDRPYNQSVAHPLVYRAKDWLAIRELVARERFLDSPADKQKTPLVENCF